MYILLAAALLPAIALMIYVYQKDKVEPEPVKLVLRVCGLGAVSGLVAGFIESILITGFEMVIPDGLLLLIVEYFIGVAAVEEACKYFCLNTMKNNHALNYVFDAVVYSVAAALGFAALENVFYVLDGGLETALMRAVLSVPGHMADGVVMGVFFGLGRFSELSGDKGKARTNYWLAFLLPVLEHGMYDAALSTESDLFALFAIVLDLAFIILAFALISHFSKRDQTLPFSQMAGQAQANAHPPQGASYVQTRSMNGSPYAQGYPNSQGYNQAQGYPPAQGAPFGQAYPPAQGASYGQAHPSAQSPQYGQAYPPTQNPQYGQAYPPAQGQQQAYGYPPAQNPLQYQGYGQPQMDQQYPASQQSNNYAAPQGDQPANVTAQRSPNNHQG